MVVRFATKLSSILFFTILSFVVKGQLTANFKATPAKGCAPLLVKFTDASTNKPTKWRWDLGNGTISFLQNPSATYFNSGSYTITLTAIGSTGTATVTKTQYINVFAQPAVNFNASVTTGCFPLPVQFTDQSTAGNGTINLWQWDFGDGLSSTLQHPLHTYKAGGSYNVTLRVRNSNGCLTTISKPKYIDINSGASASFTNSYPDNCNLPVAVDFKNTSTGSGTLSYQWFFGDGGTSTQANPSHIYSYLGTYSLKLIVINSGGCTDTLIKKDEINITKIKASFTNSDTTCAQNSFSFINNSVPTPLSNSWDFGDGTSSASDNPVKLYKLPGTYQVRLIANFGSCSDTTSKTITVHTKPTSIFTADNSVSCNNPFTVNFTNQSLNGVNNLWDFGDSTTSTLPNPSHTYTSSGNFTVQLVSTNINGCTDTLIRSNFIKIQKPSVSITSLPDSGCVPLIMRFKSNVQSNNPVVDYLWNFGDGSTSMQLIPSHIYDSNGVYDVTLIVKNTDGCMDTAILKKAVIASKKPVVNFDATPKMTCANTAVVFTDLTTGGATKWLWKFGDGFASSQQNPYHIYADTGKFTVQLIVGDRGCTDSVTYKDFIYIDPPIGEYSYNDDCKKPYEKKFVDGSIGADRWSWDFGDGGTSNLKDPTHIFATTGTFKVTQIVWNNRTGCNFVNVKNILILDTKASFATSDSVICKGGNIKFITTLSTPEVNSFNWNFGDGNILETTNNNFSHTYTAAGNYNITLITTNFFGCMDTLNKIANIRVNGPIANFKSSTPGSCLNNAIMFIDSSKSDGINPIQTYFWNFGDSTTQTVAAGPFQHTYYKSGLYPVKLLVTDKMGCIDSFSLPTPLIISKPVADFNTTDALTCPTKPVAFNNASTGPNLTYFWKFGDSTTSTLQNPVHSYNGEGLFTVSLYITDQYGCTDSMTKQDYVTTKLPKANFTMSDSLSDCPPLIVQFTNLSTNAVSKSWDFGDGTSTVEDNPSHFYSYPGTYMVQLTITGPGGCINIKQDPILIKGPTGTFIYDPITGCNPQRVNFSAKTSEVSSILWDFNNGTTISTTDSTITHTYTYPGFYLPKIILTNKEGCSVPIRGLDSISIYGVTAHFDFLNKALCDSGYVQFNDSSLSNDLITSYNWNFGDHNISSVKNPVHYYKANGLYKPYLKITTQFGCVDSIAAPFPVKIVASPQIDMVTSSNGCTPLSMSLKGRITVADTSGVKWQWDFGNGATAALQNPQTQIYTTKGLYTIGLLATNSSGCTDTISKTIEAFGLPTLIATQDTFICERRGINLLVKGAKTYNWSPLKGLSCINCANPVANPDSTMNYKIKGTSEHGCVAYDSIMVVVKHPFKLNYSTKDTLCKKESVTLFARGASSYIWTPGTGLNNPRSATPTAQPDTSTNYKVVGTDEKGCFKDSGFVFIKVYPIPKVNAGADATINVGQSYDLLPVISDDVTEVLWSPTAGIFRNSYPGITIKPIENTEYTVLVRNGGGCTSQDKINVFVICNGANIFVPNTFSPNGDGANDIFYPRGSGLFKIQNIRIFNRWGQLMFEKNDFNANDINAGWNGTFKGVKLNPDVFVYTMSVICDNNSILTYKGNIALIQ